jgi:hypothetical protein
MIEHHSDFVIIHQSKEDFVELLVEAGLSQEVAKALTDAQQEQLTNSLKALGKTQFNQGAAGGVRQIAGRYHFPLRRTLFSAVIITASLTAAGIGVVAAPAVGAVGAVAAVLAALQQLSDLVTPLSPTEISIYVGLLEVIKRRQAEKKSPSGGTAKEVQDLFRERGTAPVPTTAAILAELCNKKVVSVDARSNDLRYSINP